MAMSTFLRRPLLTAMASFGTVWTSASITQQKFISKHKVDFTVVARNASVAALVMAPMLFGWYKLMGYWSKGVMSWRWSVKITTVEQLVFSPCVLTSFFVCTGLLSGDSKEKIRSELVIKLPNTYLTSCCFFPTINFINHLYVPFRWKVVYQASVNFIWSNFLCVVKERKGMTSISSSV